MKLPDFKTEEDEARFRERHSVADYWEDLKTATLNPISAGNSEPKTPVKEDIRNEEQRIQF